MKTIKKITIGADPEFIIISKRRSLIRPGSICAGQTTTSLYVNELGCDGCGTTAEIRPEPSEDPLIVVANIHDILQRRANTDSAFLEHNWHAGSYVRSSPLGGHVHIGCDSLARDRSFQRRLVAALKVHLAPLLLLVENKTQAIKRRDCGYGLATDYRVQVYGIEYRFPSSWVTSPYVAAAVLTLSKVIAHEFINVSRSSALPSYETTRFLPNVMYIDHINTETIRRYIDPVWEAITKFELYPEYSRYIDVLKFLIDNNLTWFPKCSMKEAWGIVDASTAHDTRVPVDSLWSSLE